MKAWSKANNLEGEV